MSTPVEHREVPSGPAALARIQADVFAARSALTIVRRGPQRNPDEARAAAAELLECLETYAAALSTRRLPMSRRLRDELRLRRLLAYELRDCR